MRGPSAEQPDASHTRPTDLARAVTGGCSREGTGASGGLPTAGGRRSRVGCGAELAMVLLTAKFFQGLGIEGIVVFFEGFSPL